MATASRTTQSATTTTPSCPWTGCDSVACYVTSSFMSPTKKSRRTKWCWRPAVHTSTLCLPVSSVCVMDLDDAYTVYEVNKDEQVAWQTQTANYFSLLFEFVYIRTCFCVGACRYGCSILSASSLPSTYSCLGHRWSCEVCVSQISSQTLALCEDAVCLQTVICLETQLLDFMSSDRVPN